jgi:chaperonin GroES
MSDFSSGVKVFPLNGKVFVKIFSNSKKTPGGIHIPETAKEVPIQGKVVAVSSGIYENGTYRPHDLHEGDHVVFNWKSGVDVYIEDVEYRLLAEKDILARIEGVNYGEN